ncbi:MAG: adenosine deaminase, partial [Myxococcales bacterium]|nr:adenosine deaminase [Myxococcales bacterium]
EVDACLSKDVTLRPLVRATPGLRVPGAFDGFETTVRAVLGQQVSVKGATTLAGRLVERFETPVRTPFDGLRFVFPTPARLAQASERELASIGLPGARARTLLELARAVKAGLVLEPGVDVEGVLTRLGALPGFGPWTTQYVAMRALGSPDAFPASDLGVLKALKVTRAAEALERAESWRPWRAYATLHLWSSLEVAT